MKKLIYFRILCLLLSTFSSCKTKTVSTSDKEAYLYDIIIMVYENENFEKEGHPIIDYLLDETLTDEHIFNNISFHKLSYFDKDDIKYIKAQVKSSSSKKIDSAWVKSKKVLSTNEVESWYKFKNQSFWTLFESHYGKSGFYKLSSPIFTKDKNKFIVALSTNYFQSNSSGIVYVFEKKDNKWVIKELLSFWG